MRLNHSRTKIQQWAKFEELPNEKFTDFKKVRAAIEQLTDKECGKNKNIINDDICNDKMRDSEFKQTIKIF